MASPRTADFSTHRGVSTLELMIAVAIMAMAFVPLYDVLMGSRSDTIRTEATDLMTKVASGVIDEIAAHPFVSFLEAAGNPTGALSAPVAVDFDSDTAKWYPLSSAQITELLSEDRYVFSVTTSGNLGYDYNGTGKFSRNMILIKVEVKWQEKRGGVQEQKTTVSVVKTNPLPFIEYN